MKTEPWALAAAVLLAAAVQADMFLLSDVQDGNGLQSTNTVTIGEIACTHVSAGAQPGGIGTAAGGSWINSGGFLQAVDIKRPALDTDHDTVPDELDRDNDGDGLHDTAEITGSAFDGWAVTDPNAADTDGDGMDDAAEAAGMYDPNDPGHCLKIVKMSVAAGEITVTWCGKGGGTTNAVMSCESLTSGAFTDIVSRVAYAGGVGPWYKTTNSWTGELGPIRTFYRVQTSP